LFDRPRTQKKKLKEGHGGKRGSNKWGPKCEFTEVTPQDMEPPQRIRKELKNGGKTIMRTG